jgi:periplasmic copper chaperone A
MKRSLLFPLIAIVAAGLIYVFTAQNGIMGSHSMDHDMMMQAKPEKTGAPVTLGDITVSSAWTKAMLPGQPAGGGFLTIENKGASADRLLSVSSPATTNVQIHEMAMEGDVMKMRELPEGLEIAAGGKVELKPGGFHVMFMNMANGFKEGETVAVTLRFEKAGDIAVELPVNAAGKN